MTATDRAIKFVTHLRWIVGIVGVALLLWIILL